MDEKNISFHIRELILKYKKKTECGVVFKLNETESPLELKKVLNVIKDKIKRWGNSNIFTYSGILFENFKLIIIGAKLIEQAQDLIIFVYLSEVLANKAKLISNNIEDIEEIIKNEIKKGLVKGFPFSESVENELKEHIEKIIITDLGTQI
jgi:hypothetical protein